MMQPTNTLFPKYTNSSHSSIKTKQNKQNNHSKSEQKVSIDISPKKIYRWPTDT